MAQPYFLRRTKEAVLDLPPLSEVIVPLGMSVLQKEVYKTVLSKNKDALASIYDSAKAKRAAKANRNKMCVFVPTALALDLTIVSICTQCQRAHGAQENAMPSLSGRGGTRARDGCQRG